MFNYDYGRRFDLIDYENMGTSSRWYMRNTLLLLTSFEMEIKKYFIREDRIDVYSRIYARYDKYMWDCLMADGVQHYDGLSEYERERSRLEGAVKSFDMDRANFKQDDILNYIKNNNSIKVDMPNLKRFLAGNDVPELENVVSINVGCDKQERVVSIDKNTICNAKAGIVQKDDCLLSNDPFYEDIITDETILKLKELPLPRMKQQVAILAAEKKKSDAAIIACAKIGLLFYELGLPKPATQDLFVSEYVKHFDKLPEIPVTMIKRLYKHLPMRYRRTIDGGQLAVEKADVDSIIKAAVFAGYMEGTKGDVNGTELIASLRAESYEVPEETTLQKILVAMSKLK